MKPLFWLGMVYGYVCAFVAAALLGYFFKFPIPFRTDMFQAPKDSGSRHRRSSSI